VWLASAFTLLLPLCVSHRRVVVAKPGQDAQRNSASRSSPRSWCFVSFRQRDGVRGCWGWGQAVLHRFPFVAWLLDMAPQDLKRFSEARIRTSKLTTFVNFQLKDLDLREFASQSCSECQALYSSSPALGSWQVSTGSLMPPKSAAACGGGQRHGGVGASHIQGAGPSSLLACWVAAGQGWHG